MDDLYTSLAVIGVTGLVVVAIFFFSNRAGKEKSKNLQELAARHGWQYTPISGKLTWGTKITGKNWELISRSESVGQPSDSGSSNIQSDTVWSCKWIMPQSLTLYIGPRYSTGASGGLFLPPELNGLKEVDAGMDELAKRYILMGKDDASFDFLRISTIPRQLLAWPDKHRPLIKIAPAGMEISFRGYRLDKPEELEKIILLGESIASALGQ